MLTDAFPTGLATEIISCVHYWRQSLTYTLQSMSAVFYEKIRGTWCCFSRLVTPDIHTSPPHYPCSSMISPLFEVTGEHGQPGNIRKKGFGVCPASNRTVRVVIGCHFAQWSEGELSVPVLTGVRKGAPWRVLKGAAENASERSEPSYRLNYSSMTSPTAQTGGMLTVALFTLDIITKIQLANS